MTVTLCVAGGSEGDGAECAWCADSVGGLGVLEKLYVCPEFKFEMMVVRGRCAGDNGDGAHGVGDPIGVGEHIEAPDGVSHHVNNEDLGKAFERQTVDTRAQSLLDGADRAFDFSNMAVGGDHVDVDGVDVVADVRKLGIDVKVANPETTTGVQLDNRQNFS